MIFKTVHIFCLVPGRPAALGGNPHGGVWIISAHHRRGTKIAWRNLRGSTPDPALTAWAQLPPGLPGPVIFAPTRGLARFKHAH